MEPSAPSCSFAPKMSWKKQIAEDETLREMLLTFDRAHLKALLSFVGWNLLGNDAELRERAVALLRLRCVAVNLKIRALYESFLFRQKVENEHSSDTADPSSSNPVPSLTDGPVPPFHGIALRQSEHPPTGLLLSAPPPMLKVGYYPHEVSVQPSEDARVPAHPDVTMGDLGFYDHLGVLLKPSYLFQHGLARFHEQTYGFQLSPQQADDIIKSRTQFHRGKAENPLEVQLRLCNLGRGGTDLDDAFPPSPVVRVNSHVVPLVNRAGPESKLIAGPLNITPFVKLTSSDLNCVVICWCTDLRERYAVAINLVRRVNAGELVQRLKDKSSTVTGRSVAILKRMLREDDNPDIAPTSHKVSLCCPITKARMKLPCRSSNCDHIQCFDGEHYIYLNEKRPSWQCPICNKRARFNTLEVDRYFASILDHKLRDDCSYVELYRDGKWLPVLPERSMEITLPPDNDAVLVSDYSEEEEDDDDDREDEDDDDDREDEDDDDDREDDDDQEDDDDHDDDEHNNPKHNEHTSGQKKHHELIDLTVSDSEGENQIPDIFHQVAGNQPMQQN